MENVREELRQIQKELREHLPIESHSVRELPGGGDWIFISWQAYRDRLDQVCPDWQIDYSPETLIVNDVTNRCAISILGVRKEAIACVPYSVKSSTGKEMTRGSALDRLASEGLKNAAEMWGVARYLDDQYAIARHLWENRASIDQEMQGKIRRIIDKGNRAMPRGNTPIVNTKVDNTKRSPSAAVFGIDTSKSPDVSPVPTPIVAVATIPPAAPAPTAVPVGLYPQNHAVIAKVVALLGFDSRRLSTYFERSFPGLTEIELNPDQMRQLVKAIATAYARDMGNMEAIKGIDGRILTQMNIGIPAEQCIQSWIDGYFPATVAS